MCLISSERKNWAARILLFSVVEVSDFSHTRVPKRSPPKRRRDRNASTVVAMRSSSRVNPASPLFCRKQKPRSIIVVAIVDVIRTGLRQQFQRRQAYRPQSAVATPGNGRDNLSRDCLPCGAVGLASVRLDLRAPVERAYGSRTGPEREVRSGFRLAQK